ncbi:MAG: diguanylate cyclase [Myxococcota bacterium]
MARELLKSGGVSAAPNDNRLDLPDGLADQIFRATPAAVMITNARAQILAVNPAFTAITGYTGDEIIGKNPRMLGSGRHDEGFYENFWQTLNTQGSWQGEIWNRRKSGEIYPEYLNVTSIRAANGTITHFVAVFSDITKVKSLDAKTAYLAYHDPLTGIPNRLLLDDRLRQAMLRAQRSESGLAVMFLDLDGFKQINDNFGHARGDELLVAVAERLQQCLRKSDTLARIGGDEFAVVVESIGQAGDATSKAQKLIDALSTPFAVSGHMLSVGVSIGIALYPQHVRESSDTIGDLLALADAAMYHIKQTGKGHWAMFEAARALREDSSS